MKKFLRLGTRGSKLALWQANWVKNRLQHLNPNLKIEIVPISTRGDREQQRSLAQMGETGLFVKEIEYSLQNEKIDFAVHSAKDLPAQLNHDFELATITAREDPRDVLLSQKEISFSHLPPQARLATGSPRRKAQLLAVRPDLHMEPLRGNLDTRIQKLLGSNWDGIVAAWAGVKRLGYLRFVAEFLPLEVCLPAAGQGALALEILRGYSEIRALLRPLSEPQTETAVLAERAFLKRIGAGCHHPVGVLGQIKNRRLRLRAVICTPDGRKVIRETVEGETAAPEKLGRFLAEKMLTEGAEEILNTTENF